MDGYLRSLPEPGVLDTPLHWSEEKLNSFPYKHICRNVKKQRQSWRTLHDKVRSVNVAWKDLSYERFAWAMETVRSRAFAGIGGINGAVGTSRSSGKNPSMLNFVIMGTFLAAAVAISQTPPDGIQQEGFIYVLGGFAVLSLVPSVLDTADSSSVLLPIIDSANHRSVGASGVLALETGIGAEPSFVLRATRDVQAGEEVTISYGNRYYLILTHC